MLHPLKNNLGLKYQVLPTINLLSKLSIHSWLQFRLCLMDYGRKYMNRIFLYSSTFLGAYLFYAAILLLTFFDFIDLDLSLVENIIAIYDIFIILGIILIMLNFGAIINQ